jgi:hypothetical protein
MNESLQIINPIDYPGWDELLLTNNQSNFFHTSVWARVLSESYNYKPIYFMTTVNDRLCSLIPIMGVDSILTGKRGVALPFTDYCPLITDNKDRLNISKELLIRFGKKAGWKHFELRGDINYFKKSQASATFFNHYLDLSKGETEIFKSFKGNTKRNIKQALKEDMSIDLYNSFESVKEFYRLNCITRKLHGLPPQPWHFFKKIAQHVISLKNGFVVLASFQNKVIAGAIYFQFGNQVIYKYGASDKKFQKLRPNNLVMWEAIKWSVENGFKQFSFGRTERDNLGLLQFKRGWGAKEEVVRYYKYDLKKDCIMDMQGELKSSYTFLKKMPLPVLKLTGRLLYRHVG